MTNASSVFNWCNIWQITVQSNQLEQKPYIIIAAFFDTTYFYTIYIKKYISRRGNLQKNRLQLQRTTVDLCLFKASEIPVNITRLCGWTFCIEWLSHRWGACGDSKSHAFAICHLFLRLLSEHKVLAPTFRTCRRVGHRKGGREGVWGGCWKVHMWECLVHTVCFVCVCVCTSGEPPTASHRAQEGL